MRDLLKIKAGIICQQVNCKGVMGAGLAEKIKAKWPIVYDTYRQDWVDGKLKLGNVRLIRVGEDLLIANICGQDNYGRDKQYTEYTALKAALIKLEEWRTHQQMYAGKNWAVYIPYKMGCGLAGGDWKIVKHIISANIEAEIVYP